MNRLKELRNQKGLTLDDIEAQTGIKRGTYSNYENSKTEPKLATWQKLADFFEIPVTYLQGLDVSESNHKSEIDTEYLEKLIELAILFSFPEMILTYGNIELYDDHKPFILVAILSQILNKLGYEPKEKIQEVYIKAMNLARDPITKSHLNDFEAIVDNFMPKSQGITNDLLQAYEKL